MLEVAICAFEEMRAAEKVESNVAMEIKEVPLSEVI
jgi:hypothetical protein